MLSVGESAVELAKHSARVKQSGLHMRIWENKDSITEIFTDCLMQELGRLGVDNISLKVLLGSGSRQSRVHYILFKYLKNTGTIDIIFLIIFFIYLHISR